MEVEPEIWIQRRFPSATHQAFIEQILAAPDDEMFRLTFADWLDEHDESDYAEELRAGPMLVWETADGEKIPIRYLSDSHLLNILRLGFPSLRSELLKERRRRGLPYERPAPRNDQADAVAFGFDVFSWTHWQ